MLVPEIGDSAKMKMAMRAPVQSPVQRAWRDPLTVRTTSMSRNEIATSAANAAAMPVRGTLPAEFGGRWASAARRTGHGGPRARAVPATGATQEETTRPDGPPPHRRQDSLAAA